MPRPIWIRRTRNRMGRCTPGISSAGSHLGAANIKKGRHVLEIEVIDHAISPPIYNFAVDAFVVTKNTFNPNTTLRPAPVENAVLRTFPKFNKKKPNPNP